MTAEKTTKLLVFLYLDSVWGDHRYLAQKSKGTLGVTGAMKRKQSRARVDGTREAWEGSTASETRRGKRPL